jgi:hypothetical protein
VAKPLDSKRIVAEILAGQHDDTGDNIFQAIVKRAAEVNGRFRWRVTWDDLTVTEDDLTLDECMAVEKFAGVPWHRMDPLDSASEAAAVLIVAMNRRRDIPIDDAVKKLGAVGYAEILAGVDKYMVEPSPLDQLGTVTDDKGDEHPLS